LARYTISYYILTTLLAIVISTILTDLVWAKLMTVVNADSLDISEEDAKLYAEREAVEIVDVVSQMFDSFIPQNFVHALANDSLLAVLITAVIVGYLLNPGSAIIKFLEEIEVLITKIITWLIKVAPIGVFFLILPNLFRLDIKDIGVNLGILIGGGIANMMIHLLIVLSLLFFAITCTNPYAYWIKCNPAWVTAWGSASSAATLPVTMREVAARGVPYTVVCDKAETSFWRFVLTTARFRTNLLFLSAASSTWTVLPSTFHCASCFWPSPKALSSHQSTISLSACCPPWPRSERRPFPAPRWS